MSETRKRIASDLVMQSFNLTKEEDYELSMICARNKTRKSEIIRGAVAQKLMQLRAGNVAGDGRVNLDVLREVREAARLS